jgi:hypothetical protein
MPFVRIKRTPKGTPKYYLVASERVGGRSRQRTLAYLGDYPTVEDALERVSIDIMLTRWALRRLREKCYCCARLYRWLPTSEREPQLLNRIARLEDLRARLADLQEKGVVPKHLTISQQIWARHRERMGGGEGD